MEKVIRDNTVILNGYIVGQYHDSELEKYLIGLADYYKVKKTEFVVTKGDPWELGLVD